MSRGIGIVLLHAVIQELDFFHIVRQTPFNHALLRLSHNGMRGGLVQDWQTLY